MAVERPTVDPAIATALHDLNSRVEVLNERLTGQRELNLLRVIKDLVWLCEKQCTATGSNGGSVLENGQKALRGDY